MPIDYQSLFERLTKRYGGAIAEALEGILCPVLIPIRTLDKAIFKIKGQPHWRASFTIPITAEWADLIVPGRTGKFVPNSYKSGGGWKEVAKGRILTVDNAGKTAEGEVYCGGTKKELEAALATLSGLALPETDRESIWPWFWQHRDGFFAAHCRCHEGRRNEWRIEESQPMATRPS